MDFLSVRQIKFKDICNDIGYWIIKVKVVRLWAEHDSNNLGEVLSIEMVLMDSQGNKIQGTIPKEVFPSRSFDIKKGGFYKIGRAVVVKNDVVQESTGHPFRSDGISTPVVVVQFAKMMPFNPALFGDTVIQVVPNVTRLLLNPQMAEVFSFLEGLATNSINLFSRLNYVSRGTSEVELVDNFILSHPKKTISKLCLDAKVGIYVVLATIIGVVGNEQWLEFLSECQVHTSSFSPFGFVSSPYKMLPRLQT
ncbi:Nucleic acid-binding, OB-fold [Sesbania bispinosa]|nr:Nucleic acid-binding, OB-fold [Sesbania bispinosa]